MPEEVSVWAKVEDPPSLFRIDFALAAFVTERSCLEVATPTLVCHLSSHWAVSVGNSESILLRT